MVGGDGAVVEVECARMYLFLRVERRKAQLLPLRLLEQTYEPQLRGLALREREAQVEGKHVEVVGEEGAVRTQLRGSLEVRREREEGGGQRCKRDGGRHRRNVEKPFVRREQ